MLSGIEDVNELKPRFITPTEFNRPIEGGSGPVNLLLFMFITEREVSRPIVEGSGPCNEL